MRRLLIVLVVLASACATSDAEPSTAVDTEPHFGCPFGGPYFPLSVIDTAAPLLEDSAEPTIATAIAGFLEQERQFPATGWRLLELDDRNAATIVHLGDNGREMLAFMTVGWDDGWVWSGAAIPNDCDLELRPDADVSAVDWELDPDESVTADSTTLVLLASERGCTSGQPIGDRLLEPSVVLTTDVITIGLSARPVTGETQTCPGNPSQRVEVDLGEPLGERDVRDARSTDLGPLRDRLLAAIERDG